MQFEQTDIIEIKYVNKAPIFTNKELREFLEIHGEGTPYICAFGLIAAQIMRPAETAYLDWDRDFFYSNDRKEIIQMQHPSYKAKNQILASNKTKRSYPMLVKGMFSKWLSNQLLTYRRRYGECTGNKVFPWSNAYAITKHFLRTRKKYSKQLPYLNDPCTIILKGQDKTRYRIHAYALRRFAFTFHYWVTFNQDIVALSQFAGHASPETTWEYVYPKETIGLTQEMINRKITWDEFVFGQPSTQLTIMQWSNTFTPIVYTAPGQRRIDSYIHEFPAFDTGSA